MKIAFISPRTFLSGSKGRARQPGSFPAGLGYMAAYLRQAGHQAVIFDPDITGVSMDEVWRELEKFKPDAVGVTSVTGNFMEARRVVQEAKRRLGCVTIMGGHHATALPRSTAEGLPELDAVIMGEGEVPVLALAESFDKLGRADFSSVPGAAFIKDGQYAQNPMPAPIDDLDSLPRPALDLLYGGAWQRHAQDGRKVPILMMITSRGCPAHCTFCANARMGRRFRARSPLSLVAEVADLKKEYGTDFFQFADDCFTADVRRAKEICSLLLERKLKITWEASARVNTLLDEELLELMRRSGCIGVNVGVETSSPEIARLIRKGTTPEQAERCCALLRAHGLPYSAGFMLGNEGETRATALATIAFAARLKPVIAFFNIAMPLPGTELFDKYYKDFDRPDTDWEGWTSQGPSRPYGHRQTAMTDRQLWLLTVWAHLRFYLNPFQMLRMLAHALSREY